QGVVHVTQAALADAGVRVDEVSVAVQGFGKVGSHAARILAELGARVVAVSDEFGGVHASDGLDVGALLAHVAGSGSVVGFAGGDAIDNAALLALDVDVLIPAAVSGVLDSQTAAKVRARWVIEAANGPTTVEGDEILARAGVSVVPDILANAGGVV